MSANMIPAMAVEPTSAVKARRMVPVMMIAPLTRTAFFMPDSPERGPLPYKAPARSTTCDLTRPAIKSIFPCA